MVFIANLFKKWQAGTVAMAGQTGGAIRFVLDFFVSFFIKKKRKEDVYEWQ